MCEIFGRRGIDKNDNIRLTQIDKGTKIPSMFLVATSVTAATITLIPTTLLCDARQH